MTQNSTFCQPWTFVALSILSATTASSATVSIMFSVSGATTLTLAGPPSTTSPIPGIYVGSGTSTPFGPLTDLENVLVTFVQYPDRVAPGSESGTFNFSFNGGRDTLTGTLSVVYANNPATGGPALTDTQIRTITGGTGIFANATGMLHATGTDAPNTVPPPTAFNQFSGSGLISAPGLTAVPEPNTIIFAAPALALLFAFRRRLFASCRARGTSSWGMRSGGCVDTAPSSQPSR